MLWLEDLFRLSRGQDCLESGEIVDEKFMEKAVHRLPESIYCRANAQIPNIILIIDSTFSAICGFSAVSGPAVFCVQVVYDLLDPNNRKKKGASLEIREHTVLGIYVKGLQVCPAARTGLVLSLVVVYRHESRGNYAQRDASGLIRLTRGRLRRCGLEGLSFARAAPVELYSMGVEAHRPM